MPKGADYTGVAADLVRQQFARKLIKLRTEKDWTQSDLARFAGIHRGLVSTWEKRQSTPTAENLARVAKALGVTEDELMPSAAVRRAARMEHRDVMTADPDRPGYQLIQISRSVRTATALKIWQLLLEEDDQAAD